MQEQQTNNAKGLENDSSFRSNSDNADDSSRPPISNISFPRKKRKNEISSLDFELIVNDYSIRAVKDRLFESIEHDTSIGIDDNHNSALNMIPNAAMYGATLGPKASARPSGNVSAIDHDLLLKIETPTKTSALTDKAPLLAFSQQDHYHKKQGKMKRRKKTFFGYSGRTITRWLLTFITGLLTGIVAVIITETSNSIVRFRLQRLNRLQVEMHEDLTEIEYSNKFHDDDIFFDSLHTNDDIKLLSPVLFLSWSYFKIFFEYLAFNLVLAMASAYLCLQAPDAVGSGIPDVSIKPVANKKCCLFP